MPPSNTSSPLSEDLSLPDNNSPNDDDAMEENVAGPSRPTEGDEHRRRSRSATSSTVQIRPRDNDSDNDSDLSDLSEEEEEDREGGEGDLGHDSEEDAGLEEEEEVQPTTIRLKRDRIDDDQDTAQDPGPGGADIQQAYETDSDTNSLSPPPPSTGPKKQALPELDVEQGSTLGTDESDLESLTDSNGDPPQETDVAESKEEADRPEEDEEGDVTMRAGDLEVEEQGEEMQQEEEQVETVQMDETEGGEQLEEQETQQEEPVEEEIEEAPPSPALSIQPLRPHSSHPPPPTSAAVKELFGLEIKFAALRDALYVERMEETAAEEETILDGTHPALAYLFKNLRARRERLHEVATRRHKQVLEEILKVRDENKEAVWTWWTDERDREQWDEFQDTWAKRRRLIREKSDLDHAPGKRPKPIPKSWAEMPKPLDWAAGAIPSPISAVDAANDLAKMDPRRYHPSLPQAMSRQGSPQRYATPQTHTSNSSSFAPYTFHPEEGFQLPQYAQRVPARIPTASHHTLHRLGQGPSGSGSGSGSGSSQGPGYGPAVFNEPRREGRTVPTNSALFDSGRRSNEGTAIQQQAQAPPPAPGLGAELWGKDRMNGNGQGQGQGHGLGHSLVPGPNGRGVGITNGNGNGTGAPVGTGVENGNGNGNGETNGHKDPTPPVPEVVDQKPRYPGLTGFLTSTSPNQQPAQAGQTGQTKIGSPPKSSLGITGIPSGMPFI